MAAMESMDVFHAFKNVHEQQLNSSGVPERFWKTLFHKLQHGIFDAGDTFSLEPMEKENDDCSGGNKHQWRVVVCREDGVHSKDENQIYLVDHAWTYRPETARVQLQTVPGLLQRMAALMSVDQESANDQLVEKVLDEMWRYNQTYRIGNPNLTPELRLPIWYIMDEFGSAIAHSEDPSFRLVPFFFTQENASYSLLFPIKSTDYGNEVTRNYIDRNLGDLRIRQALMIPWLPVNFTNEPFDLGRARGASFLELSVEIRETLPVTTEKMAPKLPIDRRIRVYSQYEPIKRHLSHEKFEITDNEDEADVLWYTTHFKDFKKLNEQTPSKFVNQFPYENRVTVKDLLCVVVRSSIDGPAFNADTLKSLPQWLPTTFNLVTELVEFVSYFQQREQRTLDNTWIIKPWNLARGLDTHVTRNLNQILRLTETDPKIACKYIEDPVLFYRADIDTSVKFDIRYIVLLKSVQPLEVFVYRKFWLRFANKPYSLDHLDDYEKHFTVMNYGDGVQLHKMLCEDFVPEFDRQNPNQSYKDEIESRIFEVLKSVFLAATTSPPPKGIGQNVQSRAMFAVDLMLAREVKQNGETDIYPMVLEVNWCPDCDRACAYYPEFFNHVFATLFLDEPVDDNVVVLL